MSLPKSVLTLLLSVLFASVASGCKGSTVEKDPVQQRNKSELTEIYTLYQDFAKRQQHPPKQLSDFNKRDFQELYPIGIQALQKGDFVAVWGISGRDSGTVLAYQKDVPNQGGPVIMADGTYKTLTADEFKAAKK
jgi:hypothetical protein